jgi:glycosyltransferase involved in cell wall biosynthesis
MQIVGESRTLAESLGVLDSAVFFNRSWVDYSDRHNYLHEADAGVSTHFDHIETTMSFRTRILDYLWAGLPMVVTDGDVFAELVAKEGLGVVVPANDVDALADALERILYDADFIAEAKANIARVREDFYWDRVLEPLVSFVADARHAPDLVRTTVRGKSNRQVQPQRLPSRKTGTRHNVTRALFYLRNGGPMVVIRKVARRLGR